MLTDICSISTLNFHQKNEIYEKNSLNPWWLFKIKPCDWLLFLFQIKDFLWVLIVFLRERGVQKICFCNNVPIWTNFTSWENTFEVTVIIAESSRSIVRKQTIFQSRKARFSNPIIYKVDYIPVTDASQHDSKLYLHTHRVFPSPCLM